MLNSNAWLPIFPLNSVLFPNGVLPLKVFEARYVAMARDCVERSRPFGAVRMRPSQETGADAAPEAIGCVAHIRQAQDQDAGAMQLRIEGGERFRILETRALPDQRLEARIEMVPADRNAEVSPMHLSCASALKAVIDDINRKGQEQQGERFVSPFSQPMRFSEAGWVANRWCEILPIPHKARQKLLELEDAGSRLTIVYRYLQQHKII